MNHVTREIIEATIAEARAGMLTAQKMTASLKRSHGRFSPEMQMWLIEMGLQRGRWLGLIEAWEAGMGRVYPDKVVEGWLGLHD